MKKPDKKNPDLTTDASGHWTKQQAASFLGVSYRTLQRMMKRGKFSYLKFGARTVKFRPEQLKAEIDHCKVDNNLSRRVRGH
jgi:excisionase family DNA binding protein